MSNQFLLSAQKIAFENLRSLAAGSITNSYVGIGASFANPVRMLKVTNLSDSDLIISFDGINDQDVIAGSSAWIYDFCSNMSTQSGNLEFSVGKRVYVKYISGAPTNGKGVYVTVIYASTI